MNRRGFTLIELLVVIAVISILAAFLFPVFSKARDKARQATCLSNVKQIMLAVLAYNEDYDGVWPPSAYHLPPGETPADPANSPQYDGFGYPVTTYQLIMPYTGGHAIFHCPNGPILSHSLWYTSYGFNAGTEAQESLFIDWTQVSIADGGQSKDTQGTAEYTLTTDGTIIDPSSVYAVMDFGSERLDADFASTWKGGHTVFYESPYAFYVPGTGPYMPAKNQPDPNVVGSDVGQIANDFNNGRHSGGVIVGFCDGHAQWQSAGTIVAEATTMCRYIDQPDMNTSKFYYGRR